MAPNPNLDANVATPRLEAAMLFLHEGGLALVRRTQAPEGWTLPAEFVLPGEAPAAAATRGALELTGLRVAALGILDAYVESDEVITLAYAGEVLGGELRATARGEVRGFAPEALPWPELAFDSTRRALRDYLRRYFPRVRVPR